MSKEILIRDFSEEKIRKSPFYELIKKFRESYGKENDLEFYFETCEENKDQLCVELHTNGRRAARIKEKVDFYAIEDYLGVPTRKRIIKKI